MIFILIMVSFLFSGNGFAAIQAAKFQGWKIQDTLTTAAAGATNSLLLEDGFYLLHENNDTMQLES